MNGYETLMKLREMYKRKNQDFDDAFALLNDSNNEDRVWLKRVVADTLVQRDCVQEIARELFPDLDVDFWGEIYN